MKLEFLPRLLTGSVANLIGEMVRFNLRSKGRRDNNTCLEIRVATA